ncbi:hypothetical protein AB6N24_08700 [Cellulomonas sp. 179-A 4D5 NHS]|uniref:hypothetical protein n=1 Tax=Cellulomonas sp. 179-A 4D5 NHS TaxID=3142378 RepID=UPI0039A1DC28
MSTASADVAAARGVAQHWRSPRWQGLANGYDVPPLRAQTDADLPILVTVRLEWEHDGVELVDTVALGWTRTLVRVEMRDSRWRLGAAWVHCGDVWRQGVEPAPYVAATEQRDASGYPTPTGDDRPVRRT